MKDLINKARTTTCKATQQELSKHLDATVRKALAMNRNLSRDIANQLSHDVTVNVSFWATKNRNSTTTRVFNIKDIGNKCVLCTDIFNTPNCSVCTK